MAITNKNVRLIITYFTVFGLNILVAFAYMMAVTAFFFKRDALLFAFPALVAFCGIALQPWFIVFLCLPFGLHVGPFITTIITIPVYRHLENNNSLELHMRMFRKLKKSRTAFMIGLVTLAGCGLVYCRIIDFPPLHRGLPPKLMMRSEELKSLDIQDSRYHCLSKFIDSQWILRATVKQETTSEIAGILNMKPIETNAIPQKMIEMPTYWWDAKIRKNTLAYSTEKFYADTRGPDGWHAFML